MVTFPPQAPPVSRARGSRFELTPTQICLTSCNQSDHTQSQCGRGGVGRREAGGGRLRRSHSVPLKEPVPCAPPWPALQGEDEVSQEGPASLPGANGVLQAACVSVRTHVWVSVGSRGGADLLGRGEESRQERDPSRDSGLPGDTVLLQRVSPQPLVSLS